MRWTYEPPSIHQPQRGHSTEPGLTGIHSERFLKGFRSRMPHRPKSARNLAIIAGVKGGASSTNLRIISSSDMCNNLLGSRKQRFVAPALPETVVVVPEGMRVRGETVTQERQRIWRTSLRGV